VSVSRAPQPCDQHYFSEVSTVNSNVSLLFAGTETNSQCKAGKAIDLYFQSRLTLNMWEFVTFVYSGSLAHYGYPAYSKLEFKTVNKVISRVETGPLYF
jgi:hypothetical protein